MFTRLLTSIFLLVTSPAVCVFGKQIPKAKNTHIELHYDDEADMGSVVPMVYFWLDDIYTKEEIKVRSEAIRHGVTALDFPLYYPLYDHLIAGSTATIPFYVEPGDSMIIHVSRFSRPLSYEMKNGLPAKYVNMLRHDISYNVCYDEKDFLEDKSNAHFPEFVARVMRKMNSALDRVNAVSDTYAFSEEEKRIARNNVKLQFALWIFEFAPYKSLEMDSYSRQHSNGWQSIPTQDREIEMISDADNYAFMRRMPLNDSTCLVSRYFPRFIQSYENTHFLNHDQYLYYGTSDRDIARMDSAYMAKDQVITGSITPSLFMDVAMTRKHYKPAPSDGTIHLDEVQVIGTWASRGPSISESDMLNIKLNSKPTYNALSPSYWLFERKRIKRQERAKAILKKFDQMETSEYAEREAIMKAYEEERKKKEKENVSP